MSLQTLQFSWIVFMVLLGLLAALATYLGVVAARRRPAEDLPGLPPRRPVPLVLWFVYGTVALSMVGYLVWSLLVQPAY
ncbi:MAG TPA: hypothetical protein VGM19_07820 [Armatimonadota bacterium]|jgi:hypothetical protein